MAFILSTGVQTAEHHYSQDTLQKYVYKIFPMESKEKKRLLPIFENTMIEERQLSIDLDWFSQPHSFPERNKMYQEKSVAYAKQAINSCFTSEQFLTSPVSTRDIDHIILVSSTGIATPTIDTQIINDMDFQDSVKRTPIFGLGCAGGTSAVAKAAEWLNGQPESNVLIICIELCSLTFQLDDLSVSNFVGTALFGDGVSAVLMAGNQSPLRYKAQAPCPKVISTSSKIKKDSQSVMGWRIVEKGFEVIFNKSIPRLVKEFWYPHAEQVLIDQGWKVKELSFLVAHPGGRKVIESYEKCLDLSPTMLENTKKILKHHGNMSSPTVHFVLHEAMQSQPKKGTKSLMTSLGPGFSSEMACLEWF
ncbi:naringenin-chalcone synthase [Halobacillus salinarum]|uniref:Naringenin-chalcone synthase n=1 Tax=Halobacillus salinarum TaxID=2932257 RepID=A0ABY4EFJ6_9BACI|nr:3-oxoacyl-[acyl-carrier-protein] synthase III C-terminal domain-containing protein [Halobacillus salinarum]UOQ42755.1 naringenin-chalcone synthase [Halobacillus salinarum]